MIRLFASAFFAAGLTSLAASAQTLEPGEPVVLGEAFTLHSTILDESRNVSIRLPRAYEAEGGNYPVLYLLDGAPSQDFLHIAGMTDLSWLSGQMRDMIVVGIGTDDRQNELTAPSHLAEYAEEFPTHGGSAEFREFIAREVIPAIEARYNVTDERVLMGESLAGLFVVETALETPQLFTGYIAISPSLWWDDMALAQSAGENLNADYPEGRLLYLSIADEGGDMRLGLAHLLAALESYNREQPERIVWWYRPLPDEQHHTIYHAAALDALRTLFMPVPREE